MKKNQFIRSKRYNYDATVNKSCSSYTKGQFSKISSSVNEKLRIPQKNFHQSDESKTGKYESDKFKEPYKSILEDLKSSKEEIDELNDPCKNIDGKSFNEKLEEIIIKYSNNHPPLILMANILKGKNYLEIIKGPTLHHLNKDKNMEIWRSNRDLIEEVIIRM